VSIVGWGAESRESRIGRRQPGTVRLLIVSCQSNFSADCLALRGEDRDSCLLELEDRSPSKYCSSGCRNSPISSSGCSEADMSVNVLQTSATVDTTVQQLSTEEKYVHASEAP